MPESLSAVTCGKYVRAEKPPVSTSILRRSESVKGTGRSSDSFLFQRLPGLGGQWQKIAGNSLRRRYRSPGTHSSGNCCRFSRHSLLIPSRAWTAAWGTCAGTKVILISLRSAARVLKIPGRDGGDSANGKCGRRGSRRPVHAVFAAGSGDALPCFPYLCG